MKERLKSKVVWLSVLAQICVIIAIFVPDVSDTVKSVAVPIIEILTLFGILNNPTTKDEF